MKRSLSQNSSPLPGKRGFGQHFINQQGCESLNQIIIGPGYEEFVEFSQARFRGGDHNNQCKVRSLIPQTSYELGGTYLAQTPIQEDEVCCTQVRRSVPLARILSAFVSPPGSPSSLKSKAARLEHLAVADSTIGA
jgi:hypothetical protein